MDTNITPIKLNEFKVKDPLWSKKFELIRKNVIPYMWNALNDNIKDASASFCVKNFKTAAKVLRFGKEENDVFNGMIFADSDLYKWIEAVSYSLINHPDTELEKLADEAAELICAAQCDDGYINTYYIINGLDNRFTNLRDNHELYCFGHLLEGASAYYEATGKTKLLNAAIKMADLICDYFGEESGKCHGYPGHEICEMALIKLYDITKDKKYLNLAIYFINERGKEPNYFKTQEQHNDSFNLKYNQSHLPVKEQTEAVGHAVRAMYLYSAMAEIVLKTGDDELFDVLKKLWNSTIREKMYITGGVGSTSDGEAFSYPFNLPNKSAYAETCASVGLVFWASRMGNIEVDNIYIDTLELALFNTVLSGMSIDGKSFFYTNPLEVNPKDCKSIASLSHIKTRRQKWFDCACCPPNLARLITSLPRYAYAKSNDTLYLHMYIGGTLHTTLNNHEISLNIDSAYPNDEEINITYSGETASDITLAVRIPRWILSPEIDAGDKTIVKKDGYSYISGTFKDKDQIRIIFPTTPMLYAADSRVKSNIRKVALLRGPVVYCLESIDNGKNLKDLTVSSKFSSSTITLGYVNINKHMIISIDAPGYRLDKVQEKTRLYQPYENTTYIPVTLHYIPYCTWANRGENEMTVWVNMEHK